MGYIHPVVLTFAMLGGLYAMWLGWGRFRVLHMGVKMPFAWKAHVRAGTLTLALWVLGAFAGLFMADFLWGAPFVSDDHAWVGALMVPLAVFGYATGRRLDLVKKRRKWLPLAHGVNNFVLTLLALWQCRTGWDLLDLL